MSKEDLEAFEEWRGEYTEVGYHPCTRTTWLAARQGMVPAARVEKLEAEIAELKEGWKNCRIALKSTEESLQFYKPLALDAAAKEPRTQKLVSALEEVLRISDRKNVAWDAAHQALAEYRSGEGEK